MCLKECDSGPPSNAEWLKYIIYMYIYIYIFKAKQPADQTRDSTDELLVSQVWSTESWAYEVHPVRQVSFRYWTLS